MNVTVTPGQPSEFSPAEKALFEFKKAGRLAGWEFNLPVAAGGHTFYIDLAHEAMKVAVEIDGQQHDYVEQWLKDDYRDNLIRSAGWTIKRIDHGRVIREPDRIVTWLEATALAWEETKVRVAAEREAARVSELRRKVHKRVQECAGIAVQVEKLALYRMSDGDAVKSIATKVAQRFGKAENRDAAAHQAAMDWINAKYDEVKAMLDAQDDEYERQIAEAEEEAEEALREWAHDFLTGVLTEQPGMVWPEIKQELSGLGYETKGLSYGPFDDLYEAQTYVWEALDDGFTSAPIPSLPDDTDTYRWYVA